MVATQAVVLLVVLGLPNLTGAFNAFSTGYLTGQNAVALITTLLWAGTALLIGVLGISAARHAVRRSNAWQRSIPIVVALVVGMSCLTVGVVRHNASGFHPCCGSLQRAQSALGGNP